MFRILLALAIFTTYLHADEPTTAAQLEKQIAELQAKLDALKKASPKKPLTLEDVSKWKSIRQVALSNDGKWFAYRVGPNEGESECIIRNLKDDKETRFFAGGSGTIQFSFDSRWFACTVIPYTRGSSPVAAALGKPKVVVVQLENNTRKEYEGMNSFAFNGEAASHIAFRKAVAPAESVPTPGAVLASASSSGGDLLVRELATGTEMLYGNVAEFGFNKKGTSLAMLIEASGQAGNGVHLRDMKTGMVNVVESAKASYKSLSWHEDGNAFAVLKAVDDEELEGKRYIVLGFTGIDAKPIRTEYDPKDDKSFPAGLGISANRGVTWLPGLDAMSFGIAEQKKKDSSKTDVKKEAATIPKPTDPKLPVGSRRGPTMASTGSGTAKPELVIWHWKDDRLQPMQQVQAAMDKLATFTSIYRVKEKKFIRLADDNCKNVSIAPKGKYAIGTDNKKYQYMSNLDGKRFSDVYTFDLATGEKKKAISKITYVFSVSPTGTHLLFYRDGHYYTWDIAKGGETNLTKPITETKFIDTDDDHNVKDPPTRPLGWSRDGKFVLLSDDWDLWKVNTDGSGGVNISVNGKKDAVRYTDFIQWDPDAVDPGFDFDKPAFLKTYGEWTKKQGISLLEPGAAPRGIQWGDFAFGPVFKARDAKVYYTTKSTALDYPDYYISYDGLKDLSKVTTANPQQSDYLWCSGTRLVDYKGVDGKRLQGALYLPANYEKGKKYPTIVYIYEKLSNDIHRYLTPGNMGFSPSIYTSNGYAVFMPDITYRLNDPGISAKECILPAIDAAIATGVVDGDKLGLQGHSWGGYQTAFLVTQTNRFKAAVAGAPLTDLISMYSSVYWNSGSANQPIFESSQGRFTGGYWEQEAAYVRNSPVFHAKNVQTPLVILHNDKDGAVDFTQGIEYYNTLRRLQKPVVMLQYKGENHGLVKQENRKDYSVRMREFFDHYLQGKPAPEWWTEGVPLLKLDEHLKKRK